MKDLVVAYSNRGTSFVAVDGVSFRVLAKEAVALVGESGSGKTTIARAVAGLTSSTGQIILGSQRLAPRAQARTKDQLRRVQIVFQNPADSLNPRETVQEAISRPAQVLRGLSKREAQAEAISLLDRVRLPRQTAACTSEELSGGERQRVAVARALAAKPELLICDEITSALDVSVQAAVLELLAELQVEFGLALLFISHDLGVVASIADRVLVLQHGRVCETGKVTEVLSSPQDSYTRALLDAAPRLVDDNEGLAIRGFLS